MYSPEEIEKINQFQITNPPLYATYFEQPVIVNAPSTGEPVNILELLRRFLEVRGHNPGKEVKLKASEAEAILYHARQIITHQPALIEVNAPITICGDTHGQFGDVLRLFDLGGYPPQTNYLFLGDYVDRGKHSIEVILMFLCYKILYQGAFFLLRGNHEQANVNVYYGFYHEVKMRFGAAFFKNFTDCFNMLPPAAIVGDKIFCCHGGISKDLKSLRQIRRMERPWDVADSGLLCDLLWADPEASANDYEPSERGVSNVFGKQQLRQFLAHFNLELVCRAHEVMEDGYEFFDDRRLVTIFSAPNYCGEYENSAAMLAVSETLECRFLILHPYELEKSITINPDDE